MSGARCPPTTVARPTPDVLRGPRDVGFSSSSEVRRYPPVPRVFARRPPEPCDPCENRDATEPAALWAMERLSSTSTWPAR